MLRMRSSHSSTRYIFPAKLLFNMPEQQGLDAYRADDSGPLAKPRLGSNVLPENRIDYIHRQHFQRALTGPGLSSYTSRYRAAFQSRMESTGFASSQWTNLDNMFGFISREVASALTESVFGAALLQQHPQINDQLWEFDKALPWLSKMIPSWLNSKPHKARERVTRTLKDWNQHARQQVLERKSNGAAPDQDYQYDPVWGSGLNRDLQQALVETGKHSEDAMAAHDLGLLWGYVSLRLISHIRQTEIHSTTGQPRTQHQPQPSQHSTFSAIPHSYLAYAPNYPYCQTLPSHPSPQKNSTASPSSLPSTPRPCDSMRNSSSSDTAPTTKTFP